tara:strand:- start:493 stop:774 length:282 start_codon:yes stop_codon:yes gene_type:complete
MHSQAIHVLHETGANSGRQINGLKCVHIHPSICLDIKITRWDWKASLAKGLNDRIMTCNTPGGLDKGASFIDGDKAKEIRVARSTLFPAHDEG